MPHIDHGAETPNQRDKQRQIVEAARHVLARDGLAGLHRPGRGRGEPANQERDALLLP